MDTTTRTDGPCDGEADTHDTRPQRSGRATRSTSSRMVIAIALVVAATLLSGCQWALNNGVDAPRGRRTCAFQEANMVHVDTTGFSASQIADIRSALDYLYGQTNVPMQFVAAPGENWWETVTPTILVERAPVSGGNTAYSKAYERNGDGWFDAGVVWIDPSANVLPTGRRWGAGGSNFFKLMVHELSHQLGIADVNDSSELMGNLSVDAPGFGDGQAWKAVGCP